MIEANSRIVVPDRMLSCNKCGNLFNHPKPGRKDRRYCGSCIVEHNRKLFRESQRRIRAKKKADGIIEPGTGLKSPPLSEVVIENIVGNIREGKSIREASVAAGVNPNTASVWFWRGKKESEGLRHAFAEAIVSVRG